MLDWDFMQNTQTNGSPLAHPFLNTVVVFWRWWTSSPQTNNIKFFVLISECTLYCRIKDIYLWMGLLHIVLYSQQKDESLAPLFCLYLICLLSHLTGLWKAVRFQLWLAEGDKKETTKKRRDHNSSGSNFAFPSWHCTGVARRYCEPRTLIQTNPFSFFCQRHMRSPLTSICVTLYFYLLWKEHVTLDTVSTHAFRLLSFRVKGFLCSLHECVFQEISAISWPPTSV